MERFKITWVWVVPVLLIAMGLVIGRFAADALWYDEVTTMIFIGGGKSNPIDLGTMFFRVATDGAWPPGYFFMAYLWDPLIGGVYAAHRFVALWFGLLTIAVMYQLGKSIFQSREAGFISALLMATSAFFLYQFHEARGYTFWVFASALNLWFYWRMLNDPSFYRSKNLRYGFVLSIGLVLYTHYVGIVSIFLIGTYHLIFQQQHRRYKWIIRLFFNGCLLFTPWMTVFAINFYNKSLTVSGNLPATYLSSFEAFSNGIFPLVIILLGLALLRIRQHSFLMILFFWIIGMYVIVAIGTLRVNFVHHPRHIMAIMVPIVLILVYIILEIHKKTPLIAFSIILAWVGFGALNAGKLEWIDAMQGQYPTIPERAMETTIGVAFACAQADDRVVLALIPERWDTWIHNLSMYYHFRTAEFGYAQLQRMEPIIRLGGDSLTNIPYIERIPPFVEGGNHIWLFMMNNVHLQRELDEFENTIADMGWTERDLFLANEDLTGYVYYSPDAPVDLSCVIMN